MKQLSLFDRIDYDTLVTDLFIAYYDARKNKRNTINQLAFEKNLEQNIFNLASEIESYSYFPQQSICFIVNNPVKREVFAANFRDRVVHHYLYNYIALVFEKTFINDSYSCRKYKGIHYGIKRIDHFIRSCSENYKQDCFILKLDIKGYFMSMDRDILYKKIQATLLTKQAKADFPLSLILHLIKLTVYNDPTANCIIKGKPGDWQGLPDNKSLFHTKPNCGLPIGNLTSQLFGNIYLNDFDHYIKQQLSIKYYGRYVDDFILVHRNKHYLKLCLDPIRQYLKDQLNLDLHPDKVYLQHFSRGVKYLGAVIKPHRIYIANRTKGNFYKAIQKQNRIAIHHKPTEEEIKTFQSSMNSYLGIMKHFKTYSIRKTLLFRNLNGWWWNYVFLSNHLSKFCPKSKKSFPPLY